MDASVPLPLTPLGDVSSRTGGRQHEAEPPQPTGNVELIRQEGRFVVMTRLRYQLVGAISGGTTATTAAALTATLGAAAACWVIAIDQMRGMDMGVATRLGSFGFFAASWVSMMAAMMLPGAVPALLRRAHASGRVLAAPVFAVSYIAVWAVVGVAVYALYRPHGTVAAGVVVTAAGVYELTPIKRHFRLQCHEKVRSGLVFGLDCVGSSAGLMAMLVVLGVMSVTWMAVIAIVVVAQKILPARATIDVPLALAIVGLGVVVLAAPGSVPALVPTTGHMPMM
jgi:predicted metal-binding membrane protein